MGVVSLVVLTFGVGLVIIGVSLNVSVRYIAKKWIELDEGCTAFTEAELVNTVCRSSGFSDDNTVAYHGVYTYVSQDGVRVQVENENGYGTSEDVPGPRVTIRYNPEKPAEFILPEEHASNVTVAPTLKKAGVITLALGIPLTIAGVVLLLVM